MHRKRSYLIILLLILFVIVSACSGDKEDDEKSKRKSTQLEDEAEYIILSAGIQTMCASINGDGVKCWGRADSQSTGTYTDLIPSEEDHITCGGGSLCYPTPVEIANFPTGKVQDLVVSLTNACAVVDGDVYCWGTSVSSALGYDAVDTSSSTCNADYGLSGSSLASDQCSYYPRKVTFPEEVKITEIDGEGWHYCALTEEGDVYCWGWNGFGQLGVASDDDCSDSSNSFVQSYSDCQKTPKKVTGLSNITKISIGLPTSCFLTSAGAMVCAGSFTDGTTSNATPTSVHTLYDSDVQDILVGAYNYCALKNDGKFYCMGSNDHGELGVGDTVSNYTTPQEITEVEGLNSISSKGTIPSTAFNTYCALVDNKVYCWGYNGTGAAGEDQGTDNLSPVEISGLPSSGITQVKAGYHSSCAATDTEIYCWGSSQAGAVGMGSINGYSTSALQVRF